VSFVFPKLKPEGTVEYKRYVDADLETVAAATATGAGVPLELGQLAGVPWKFVALGGVVVFGAALAIWRRRRPKASAVGPDEFALPAEYTPFTVFEYLGRVARARAASMPEADRMALETDQRRIGESFFKAGAKADVDLRAIAERWRSPN
jgi:hypothetical protein